MDTSMLTLSATSIVLIPLVVALAQVVKMFITDTRWSAVIYLILGILAGFVVPMATLTLTLLQGILVGLSASGLYSGTKATFTPNPSVLGTKFSPFN